MLKIEKFVTPSPEQWEITIEGMRNAMNSWDRMDSSYCDYIPEPGEKCGPEKSCFGTCYDIGSNDMDLMMRLNKGGAPHAKYRRMLPVHVTVTAPLYWWKEFETYRIGVASNPGDIEFNSCSTMHKIHAKPFILDDFSHEHLDGIDGDYELSLAMTKDGFERFTPLDSLSTTIVLLNEYRKKFLEATDSYLKKEYWWQMIQLLPSSYNQKRTIYMNYQVLYEIYEWRRNHKLDEWHTFAHWIEELPYSELITGVTE